jgi:hypothetical protein
VARKKKTSVITDKIAQQIADAAGGRSDEELFPEPSPTETGIPFPGPAFGPGGDVFFSPREQIEFAKKGFFTPTGTKARVPGTDQPFLLDIGEEPGFGEAGTGAGRAAPDPTFGIGSLESRSPEALRDKLIGLYESWTRAFPDRPSLDFVTNQALGGAAVFDIRANVQATPEFQTRFKQMPAGMDVREYDQALVQANSLALEVAGRPISDIEIEKWFEGDGDAFYDSLKGATADPLPETNFITEEQFERQPIPEPTPLEQKQEQARERTQALIDLRQGGDSIG